MNFGGSAPYNGTVAIPNNTLATGIIKNNVLSCNNSALDNYGYRFVSAITVINYTATNSQPTFILTIVAVSGNLITTSIAHNLLSGQMYILVD